MPPVHGCHAAVPGDPAVLPGYRVTAPMALAGRPSMPARLPEWCPAGHPKETTMNQNFRILGIAGSLRRQSWNRAALEAARDLLPPGVVLQIFDLAGIPLFNEDEEDAPESRVLDLRDAVRAADGILIATPEYNYSIPGVLKNAIDWASRPYGRSAWQGKPAAILSASTGALGGIRAQYHLRQVLVSQDMKVVAQPEVVIGNAPGRFDATGRLTDPVTRDLLSRQLGVLVRLMAESRAENLAKEAGKGLPAGDSEEGREGGRQPDRTRGVARSGRALGFQA